MTCRSVVARRNMGVFLVMWVALFAGGVKATLVPYILGDTTIMVDGSALGYNSPLLAHLRNGMPLRRGSGTSSDTYTGGTIVDSSQNQGVSDDIPEEQGQVMTWDSPPQQAPQEHLTSNSDFLATHDGMLDINIVPQNQEGPPSDYNIYSGRPPPIPNSEPAGIHFNEDLAFANSPPFYYSVENPDISQVSQKIHHIVTLLSHTSAGGKPNDRAPIPLAETLDYPVQLSDSPVNRQTAITNNDGFAGVSVMHMVPKDSGHHDANFANPGDYNPLLSTDPAAFISVPGAEVNPYDLHEHSDTSPAASGYNEHWSPDANHMPSFSQTLDIGSDTLATQDQSVLTVFPPSAPEITSHDTDIPGQTEGDLGLAVASDARLSHTVLGEPQGTLHNKGGPQMTTHVEVAPHSDIVQTTVTSSTGPWETVTDATNQRETVTDSTATLETVTDLNEITTGWNDELEDVTDWINQRHGATESTTQQKTVTDSSVLQVTLADASHQQEIVTDVTVQQQSAAGSNNTLNHNEVTAHDKMDEDATAPSHEGDEGKDEGTTAPSYEGDEGEDEGATAPSHEGDEGEDEGTTAPSYEGDEGEDRFTEATQPPTEHPLNIVLKEVLSHTVEKLNHEEKQDTLHGATEHNDQLALNQAMADLLGTLFNPKTDSSEDEVVPQAGATTVADDYGLDGIGEHRNDFEQTLETTTLPFEEHTHETDHALVQNDGEYLQANYVDDQSTLSVIYFDGEQEKEDKGESDAYPASEDRPHSLTSDHHSIPHHYPYPILTDFPLTRGEPEIVGAPLEVLEGDPSHYSPGHLIPRPTTQENISDEDAFLSRHEPPRPDDEGLNTWFDRDPISIFDPLHTGSSGSGANTGIPQGTLVSGTNTGMLQGILVSGTNTGMPQGTIVSGTNTGIPQGIFVSGTDTGMPQGSTASGFGIRVPELRPAPGHPLPPLPGVNPEETTDYVSSTVIPSNLLLLLETKPQETTTEGSSSVIPSNLPPLPGENPEETTADGGSSVIPSNLPPLPGENPEETTADGGSSVIPSNLPPLPGENPEETTADGGSSAIPSNLPPLPGENPEGTTADGGSTGPDSVPGINDTIGAVENDSDDRNSNSSSSSSSTSNSSNSTSNSSNSSRNETKSSVFDGAVFHSVYPELIQKSSCRCGLRLTSKIVGGQPTEIDQFPWMAAIMTPSTGFVFCGGSIISDLYVLTACHCVNGRQASDLVVRLGETTRSGTQAMLVPVQEIIVHPKYSATAVTRYDIALLKLSRAIEYNERVLPVCLSAGKNKYTNEQAIVSGWGRNQFGGSVAEGLQEVSVRVLSTKDCRRNSQYTDTEVHNRVLCAAAEGKDACQGDSGGPLVHLNGDQYTQIGVVSWGIGCADNKYPGIYTRVSAFSKWILSNAREGRACQGSLFRTDLHKVKGDTIKNSNNTNIKDQDDSEGTGVDSFIDSILKPSKQRPVTQLKPSRPNRPRRPSLTIRLPQIDTDSRDNINKKNKRKRPNQNANNTRNNTKTGETADDMGSPENSNNNNMKQNKNRRKNNKNKGGDESTNNKDYMNQNEEIMETEESNNKKNKTRNKGAGNRRKNDKYIGITRNKNRNKNRNKVSIRDETDDTKPADEDITQTNNKMNVTRNKNNNNRRKNNKKYNEGIRDKIEGNDKVEDEVSEEVVDWSNITEALRAIASIIRKEAMASATQMRAD